MAATRVPLEIAEEQYTAIVLDTCVLIDAYDAHRGLKAAVPLPRYGARATSFVSLYEFLTRGKATCFRGSPGRERRNWLEQAGIRRVAFPPGFDRHFEPMLHTDACPPGLADALIASQCVVASCPLMTDDENDFDGVDGLVLVSS